MLMINISQSCPAVPFHVNIARSPIMKYPGLGIGFTANPSHPGLPKVADNPIQACVELKSYEMLNGAVHPFAGFANVYWYVLRYAGAALIATIMIKKVKRKAN